VTIEVGCIVLAGGASTRMGRPKAWLDAGGRPLLEHVVRRLVHPEHRILIVGSGGQELPDVEPLASRIDDAAELVHAGPLSGIGSGLAWLRAKEIGLAYLTSCDAAWTNASYVSFLRARLAAAPERDGVAPVERAPWGLRWQPLAALLKVEPAAQVAEQLLRAGERRAQELCQRLDCLPLDPSALPDRRVLTSCNTPAEWEALRHELFPTFREPKT